MSSQLKVSSIRDTSNNEALTISSGNVSFNNTISAVAIGSSVTGFTGIKNADQWRLTANSDSGSGYITSNLEQNDSIASSNEVGFILSFVVVVIIGFIPLIIHISFKFINQYTRYYEH